MPLIKRCVQPVLLILLIMMCLVTAFAATTAKNGFNLDSANKRFDAINIKLSTQNLNVKNLENAVIELESLQDQAKLCVTQHQRQLQLMSAASSLNSESGKPEEKNVKYFNGEKRVHEEELANCRLFALRTKESIIAFKETISKLGVNVLLTPRTALWNLFSKNPLESLSRVKLSKIEKNLYTQNLSHSYAYILLGLLIFSLVLGSFFIYMFKGYYKDEARELVLVRITTSLARFVIPILFFGLASLFFVILNRHTVLQSILESAAYALLAWSVALCIIYYVFMSDTINKVIFYSLALLFTYLSICFLIRLVLEEQQFSALLLDFSSMIYLILLSLISILFLWSATRALSGSGWRITTQVLSSCYLFAVILITCLGYLDLAEYLIYALLSTVLLCGVTWLLIKIIQMGIHAINTRKTRMVRSFASFLGIKPRRNIVEVTLVQLALYLIIGACFVLFFLHIWDVPQNYIYQTETAFIEGFAFSSISISLLSIVYALLLFALINLIGRSISAMLSRRHKFQGELDTQSAVASIVTYVSFSIALVASLIVLGINFTGLAIIIGALSVGIGLGLQPIVNNFVSGLVLLIEKPIKSGDRILIDGIEGFVKKVRIRSTQIMTLAKEDVIIPNSDLVTKSVTNYMFRNSIWRVTTQVGVAYGSDIELVKNVLMDVAKDHESVLQEAPNAPIVLFKKFGNSSLIFELWCVIQDVNKKYYVVSELNFKIDHAFREVGITIAFPQQDVHIKNYTQIDKPAG